MPVPKPIQAIFKWTPSGLGVFVTAQRSLSKTLPNLLRKLEERDERIRARDIGDLLALMGKDPDFRRLAILGAPGSGKTTCR